jgi:nitrilase
MYPGSIFGDLFSERTQINIRQHALESACFVVCATAWLDPDQQAQIVKDTGGAIGAISSGCFTAIVAPDSTLLCEPIRSGEGIVIAELDFTLIEKRKQMMDARPLQPAGVTESLDRSHPQRARSRTRRASKATR